MKRRSSFSMPLRLFWIAAVCGTMLLCVCVGSVAIPLSETLRVFRDLFSGTAPTSTFGSILLSIRLPRVLCVALVGASLSVCGCAMQGLLRNPLADGSTLGVSAGASLGAVLALALGFQIPGLRYGATMFSAMFFAFLSLLLILSLAYLLDRTLETMQEIAMAEMRTHTMDVTQQVINDQMRAVQEIASMLGETTARSKTALLKLQKVKVLK